MKKIVVPTDFSTVSKNAAHYAAKIARHVQADIILVHILPLPVILSEGPLPPEAYEVPIEGATQSLKELKKELEDASNDKLYVSYSIRNGSLFEELDRISRDEDVFSVVMGTSGAGAASAFFLGSFSLQAVRRLDRLIVVPPGYHFKGVHKIGLACDMQHVTDTIPFPSIKEVVHCFEAQLEVLYVHPAKNMPPQVLPEMKFIQQNLEHLHPQIRIITSDDTQVGLDTFIDEEGVDMLLLVPKDRGFMESIFHRSLSRKMALRPQVPIMILR